MCNCKRDMGYHYHRVIVIWSILYKLYCHYHWVIISLSPGNSDLKLYCYYYRVIVSLSLSNSDLKHIVQYILLLSLGDSDVKNKLDDLLEY